MTTNKQAEPAGYLKPHTPTLGQRIKDTKTTRWVRFGIVSAVFFAWVVWMGNPWLALLWLLLVDIYITGYIPFTWWKKSNNKTVRAVMSWVDAIVYALILVYFVFAFVGQNYTIPSSSLEKTLLTGDYLFVNKMTYGPRVPMTPVHFPLVHNELPILGTKSYLDTPSLKYHRLKGFRNIERGDIVVFNFPAGDTVMSKVQNPDYYTLISLYGRDRVLNDTETFGTQIYRPVDRRENYVKRAVGLPGETLRIVNDTIYIDGAAIPQPADVQFNYLYQLSRPLTDDQWDELGISVADRHRMTVTPADSAAISYYGMTVNADGTIPPIYGGPLTATMLDRLNSIPGFIAAVKAPAPNIDGLYPTSLSADWTLGDYGGEEGILIPKKGLTVELTPRNWALYERPIRVYEGNTSARMIDGQVFIDGKPATDYTFLMDYYFMMGDNRDNSLDSRFWGFVPEDHVVGTPWRVLASFNPDRSLFTGSVRWDRIFKDANPDKPTFDNAAH